ncbi:hypothetical protein [Acetobacter fabarum]|uniref:hypothetical protein n=1 Tax=Acetobacter fabarum TaxID=483199 RepID=UPI0014042F43|nr:hypothetical protein [Acetobacter fabarum]
MQPAWCFPTTQQTALGTGFGGPPTTRCGWSRDEELYLARTYPTKTDAPFISKLIGRTLGAVRRKAQAPGLGGPPRGRGGKDRFSFAPPPPPPAQSGDNLKSLPRIF